MQRAFNHFELKNNNEAVKDMTVGLVFDATFFSRVDGVLVFRSQQKNLYWRFIESETLREIEAGLKVLDERGYQFSSFTIDGRKGVIQLLLARYPGNSSYSTLPLSSDANYTSLMALLLIGNRRLKFIVSLGSIGITK